MDVAHFIKLYVNFLSDLTKSKKVKVFYKAAIGQLILCQTIERATTILKAILIVASCETDGLLINTNEYSSCETQKQFLKNIVQPHGLEEALFDEEVTEKWESMRPTNESIFDDTNEESENLTDKPINCWSDWFEDVEKEVEMVKTTEIGIHDNPFNLPEFCARLKKGIKTSRYGLVFGYKNLDLVKFRLPVLQ
uniref:Uncharacterized protein LOC114348585 n=1 Tax=Diabrotica virgifera virgifera TaxID=50390 RepID=A0A6P7GZZ6_DIAVI